MTQDQDFKADIVEKVLKEVCKNYEVREAYFPFWKPKCSWVVHRKGKPFQKIISVRGLAEISTHVPQSSTLAWAIASKLGNSLPPNNTIYIDGKIFETKKVI